MWPGEDFGQWRLHRHGALSSIYVALTVAPNL
ncbi:hypothetical protein FAIPA1_210046 [Frankia sp. AiPs1]